VSIRWSLTEPGGLDLRGLNRAARGRSAEPSWLWLDTDRAGPRDGTDGQAALRYLSGGVVCDVALPPTSMARSVAIAVPAAITFSNIQKEPKRSGGGNSVLVVEDSFMIISALELAFESFGWTIVGPATRVPKALALVKTENFDAVLLDVNLDGKCLGMWPRR